MLSRTHVYLETGRRMGRFPKRKDLSSCCMRGASVWAALTVPIAAFYGQYFRKHCLLGNILYFCPDLGKSEDMKIRLDLHTFLFLSVLFLSGAFRGQTLAAKEWMPRADSSGVYLPSDSLFARFLQSRDIPVTRYNKMTLLTSGRTKFTHLFRDIRKAQKSIHLEYFNFRNDSIAKELFTLLAEKAKEGVKVRAMFDDFGNLSNSRPLRKEHLKMLNDRGIEIIRFDPIRFPYVNHIFCRDHQKIVVIDGRTGYTGGMNIADYYINGLPEIGAWRDMHLRIEGPAAEQLQKAFLNVWNEESEQQVEGKGYFPYVSGDVMPDTMLPRLGNQVAIVQRVPKVSPDIMRKAYITALDVAERKVQIINPYFTPTRSVRKAIKRAAKRGVRVEIMIPGKSDIPFTPDAGFYIANKLRKAGAHIYVFNGGFHHSKVMMVDDRFCTVGSTNLNSRSLRCDYEINAFIFDLPVTAELGEVFKADKQNCTVMTRDEYRKRGAWKRFVGWFAHLFTPFL